MDPQPPMPSDQPPFHRPPETAPRRISRRAAIVGGVIAVLMVAGIGWLAWDLTHPSTQVGSAGAGRAGGGPGSGGGPGGFGGGSGRGGPPTTVGVAVAERADIPITLEALGTVVPLATVRVRPQVSGVLQQLLFKEGQMVRKGELLALIDPRQFQMALQQASGQRMRDEAQLEAARVTLQRYRTLLRQDSIARQDVDTQTALVKQLEGTVVSDKANEGMARLNLGYTRIVAPVAGRVGLRTVDIGNVVSSSDANGVALITQLSPIDVEFAISQDQAPALQQNAGAAMEAKALDRTRTDVLDTGVFASLDNQVDTQTGTVRAKARFGNTRLALFPSQFVNVQLKVRTIRDAVMVPVSALRQGGNGEYVFVLNQDRTVSQRPVRRGQATVDKVQIASGLQVGERVITEGADRLRDGSRVVLPGDAPDNGGARGFGGGGRRRGAASSPQASPGAAPAPVQGASAPEARASAKEEKPRRMAGPDTTGAANGNVGATPDRAPASEGHVPAGGGMPTAQQRQRFLDQASDDPQALARRKAFLEKIDQGDPAALARWQGMIERRRDGAQAAPTQ